MAASRCPFRHYRLLSTTTTATTTTTINNTSQIQKLPDHNNFYDDDGCWNTVKALLTSREFPKIHSFLQSCKQDSKIREEGYVSTLIRCYGAAGMYDKAFKLYNQMEEFGTPRSSLSFNALLSANNLSKKKDLLSKLFYEMPQKYRFSPDKFSYHILIKSLCKMGLTEKALSMLKDMEERKFVVDTVVYGMILDALYRTKKSERAKRLWNEMIEKGCSPDVGVYNVRILHAGKSEDKSVSNAGNPDDILALMEEMKMNGLKPDVFSYNKLFTCYSKRGMLEEARQVYQDLEENGCFPSTATYRLLILHCVGTQDFDMAYEVFKNSVEKHKVPGYQTLKKLVDGLVKSGKRKEAKELVETMRGIHRDNLKDWKKLEAKLGLDEDENGLIGKPEAIGLVGDENENGLIEKPEVLDEEWK